MRKLVNESYFNWQQGNPSEPGIYKVCCQASRKGIEKVFVATWLGERWLNDWVDRNIIMWSRIKTEEYLIHNN